MTSLETLLAREAIRDVLARYCGGVDRADAAAVAAVFHPGARCRYGKLDTVGEQLAELVARRGSTPGFVGQHHVTNILIDMDGTDRARVESYFLVFRATAGTGGMSDSLVPFGGRYLDLFTQVSGDWRIAERTVVSDWLGAPGALADGPDSAGYLTGTINRQDPVYRFRGVS